MLGTEKILKKFASKANWNMPGLHEDIERFSDFIISAFRNSEYDISLDEFLESVTIKREGNKLDLPARNYDKKKILASKIFMFSKYEDGISLLQKFTSQKT